MSSSRRAEGMLLSLLLVTGACGGSAAISARSKDAGATGGANAGGARATGGAGAGGAGATGGAGGTDACAGSSCRDAAVEPDSPQSTACAANTSTCVGDAIAICNKDGTGIVTTVPCDTGDSCAVQGPTANCKKKSCQAGFLCKDGAEQVVETVQCSGGGLEETVVVDEIVVEDCGAKGMVCAGNIECLPQVCQPGTTSCTAFGTLMTCSAKGDRWSTGSCLSPLKCISNACRLPICTPNQPVCNGTVATTCSADGTAYLGGTQCSDAGKICDQGVCVDCWPTTYFCSGATVRHCAADGMSSTLFSTCTNSQYCDDATSTCKAQLCTPGQPACNGEIATTCNADGSGYLAGAAPCTDTGRFCYQGACASLACSPAKDYCSGSTVRHCAADGTSSTVSSTCTNSQYCDDATSTCKAQVCTPSQPVCNGNVATTCNADGSGYVAAGTSCGSAMMCTENKCQSIGSCNWEGLKCVGAHVVHCSSGAYSGYVSSSCTNLQYCDATTATCKPL